MLCDHHFMIVARHTCDTHTPEARNVAVLPEFHKGGSSNRSVMMRWCNQGIEADARQLHAGAAMQYRRGCAGPKSFASLCKNSFAERVDGRADVEAVIS